MPPAIPLDGPVSEDDTKRFWTKTRKTRKSILLDDGSKSYCIEWTAATRGGYDNVKYGVFSWNKRTVYAHRFSYYATLGVDPGASTDHLCHNVLCVNVEHLRGGTIAENNLNRRCIISEYCKAGHLRTEENTYTNPGSNARQCRECLRERDRKRYKEKYAKEKAKNTHSSEMRDFNADRKLTWDNVHKIIKLYTTGEWSQRKLAREFKVSQPLIGQIVRGEIWKKHEENHKQCQ